MHQSADHCLFRCLRDDVIRTGNDRCTTTVVMDGTLIQVFFRIDPEGQNCQQNNQPFHSFLPNMHPIQKQHPIQTTENIAAAMYGPAIHHTPSANPQGLS